MSEARAYEPNVTRVRTVTVIPPRLKPVPGMPTLSVRPKRVAAYARVSTNSEEQLTSYDAQVNAWTSIHTSLWRWWIRWLYGRKRSWYSASGMGWNMNINWLTNHSNPLNSMRNIFHNILFMKIFIEEYMDILGIFNGQNDPNVLLYTL